MHLWPLDLEYNKASYEGKTRKEKKERKNLRKKRKKERKKKETDHPTMLTVPVDCVEIV